MASGTRLVGHDQREPMPLGSVFSGNRRRHQVMPPTCGSPRRWHRPLHASAWAELSQQTRRLGPMTQTSTVARPSGFARALYPLAIVVTVLVLAQAAMGMIINAGSSSSALLTVHKMTGYMAFIAGILAAVSAFMLSRQIANMGVFFHALTVAVLMLIQIGLGEAGVQLVHVVLGVVIAVAGIALIPIARKRLGMTSNTPAAAH